MYRATLAKPLKNFMQWFLSKKYFTKEWKTAARAVGGAREIKRELFPFGGFRLYLEFPVFEVQIFI